MPTSDLSANFLRFNAQQNKNLVIVVDIDGVDLLSNVPVYTYIRYGDPDIVYGGQGLVYGGLRKLQDVRDILDLDKSSMTIAQRLEPEQGKGSVSQISLSFIDLNGYMSQVVSRGTIIPDIMGRSARIWVGYTDISYPEEYLVAFRCVVTSVDCLPGSISLQFSDPNVKRRESVFNTVPSILSAAVTDIDTVIPVVNNADYYEPILGPDGTYDVNGPWNSNGTYNALAAHQTGVRTFLKIDEEYIEYGPLGFVSTPKAFVQSLVYTTVNPLVTGITISYTAGGSAGSEVVTVVTTAISVQIQSGVSTATQIIAAIVASVAASDLVTVAVGAGFSGSDPQTAAFGPILVSFGFSGCLRGARGSIAAAHTVDTEVDSIVEFQENAMILALKLMLSGWAGDWISDVAINSIVTTADAILGDQPGAVILPQQIDAVRDYGLIPGDYVTISGSPNPSNNGAWTIVRFADLDLEPNRIIYLTNLALIPEYPPPISTVLAFRSQFDTYPVLCGVALTSQDVDVQTHIDLKNNFLHDLGDRYRFFQTQSESLKTFIEQQIYWPVACYSLTRRGKLSVGLTKPPIVGDSLIFLSTANITNPNEIKVNRSLNNRKFYNEIDWTYDFNDDGTARSTLEVLDESALAVIGISSILPIAANGIRTDLGSAAMLNKRSQFLLSRYRNAATQIDLNSFWEQGVEIEAGDVVALQDDGNLQITNFDTGERNIGTQLFEVVNRSLMARDGNCDLTLISGIGADATDRFATISPSSNIVSGTNDYLILEDSYSAKFPGNEIKKWTDYSGQRIRLHDLNYTVSYDTTITGFDPVNNYRMNISGFTSLPPDFTILIVDIPPFPDSTSKLADSIYKSIHAYFGPSVEIVSGTSDTQFDVSSGDALKFFVGCLVRVHKPDYTVNSPNDLAVSDISGTTITLSASMGFTPDNTFTVTGIGFPDRSGAYRYI